MAYFVRIAECGREFDLNIEYICDIEYFGDYARINMANGNYHDATGPHLNELLAVVKTIQARWRREHEERVI